jgi:hypothetical protein
MRTPPAILPALCLFGVTGHPAPVSGHQLLVQGEARLLKQLIPPQCETQLASAASKRPLRVDLLPLVLHCASTGEAESLGDTGFKARCGKISRSEFVVKRPFLDTQDANSYPSRFYLIKKPASDVIVRAAWGHGQLLLALSAFTNWSQIRKISLTHGMLIFTSP